VKSKDGSKSGIYCNHLQGENIIVHGWFVGP
jgi:hypothetical protein